MSSPGMGKGAQKQHNAYQKQLKEGRVGCGPQLEGAVYHDGGDMAVGA